MVARLIEVRIADALKDRLSFMLLGPRQTGKTTTVTEILRGLDHLEYNLMETRERLKFEKNPSLIIDEIRASSTGFVFIDEVQKVPDILDNIQILIDRNKKVFALTGSSARKLRRAQANLLPGRIIALRLDPLIYPEYRSLYPLSGSEQIKRVLKYGELPAIFTMAAQENMKASEDLLYSYVGSYIEEEVRAESLARKIGSFSRFLKIAAEASGRITSMRALAQDLGLNHQTISDYYGILVDCLLAERVDALVPSSERGRAVKAVKYLFFDTGVANAAAEILGPADFTSIYWGNLFEQWVGLSLLRFMRVKGLRGRLFYWRDYSGREIDWIIEYRNRWVPIEVKWSENINPSVLGHLEFFLDKYRKKTAAGYVVFTGSRARQVGDRITALPAFSFLEKVFAV